MKKIFLILLLLNASGSYSQETPFDENLGLTGKILPHGEYKGMLFQDAKKQHLDSKMHSQDPVQKKMYEYINANPDKPEILFLNRVDSVTATQIVAGGTTCQCCMPSDLTKQISYYWITGKNLADDAQISALSDEDFKKWETEQIAKFTGVLEPILKKHKDDHKNAPFDETFGYADKEFNGKKFEEYREARKQSLLKEFQDRLDSLNGPKSNYFKNYLKIELDSQDMSVAKEFLKFMAVDANENNQVKRYFNIQASRRVITKDFKHLRPEYLRKKEDYFIVTGKQLTDDIKQLSPEDFNKLVSEIERKELQDLYAQFREYYSKKYNKSANQFDPIIFDIFGACFFKNLNPKKSN